MKTIVYIDGFNLYYGALKGGPHRWLDLGALCPRLLPGDQVVGIRYFTARVKARPNNPDAAQRQQAYLRALGTVPDLTIHLGHFLKSKTRMALVSPPPCNCRSLEDGGEGLGRKPGHLPAGGRFQGAV